MSVRMAASRLEWRGKSSAAVGRRGISPGGNWSGGWGIGAEWEVGGLLGLVVLRLVGGGARLIAVAYGLGMLEVSCMLETLAPASGGVEAAQEMDSAGSASPVMRRSREGLEFVGRMVSRFVHVIGCGEHTARRGAALPFIMVQ